MAALTNDDKAKIRYHLGYLASGFAASMQFGIPRPYQTVFMVETAMMLLVEPYAINRVRGILLQLERIEEKLKCSIEQMGVEVVGNIRMRKSYPDDLEREYQRWSDRLADIFGVPKYAFSNRTEKRGPGSVIRVVR